MKKAEHIEIKRLSFSKLQDWKMSGSRRPLVILGARQIGKTHLIKTFAKQYSQHVYINFEEDGRYHQVFALDFNIKRISDDLSLLTSKTIDAQTLVIFDEIQACPRALTALKYFAEAENISPVIGAGSLLGVAVSEEAFPIGKIELFHMYPLTFAEFVGAVHGPTGAKIYQTWPHSPAQAAKFHELRRQYMLVGGMPQAVRTWVEMAESEIGERAQAVRAIQKAILVGYESDFAKHAGKMAAPLLFSLYRGIAAQLMRYHDESVGRFRFRGIVSGKKEFAHFDHAFTWLDKAGLIIRNYVIDHTPHYPLAANSKASQFKAFYHDVGLLGAACDIGFGPLLAEDYGLHKGFVLENFAATELAASLDRRVLYSWKENTAEIEYLVADDRSGRIFPLEVKSTAKRQAKSLGSYRDRFAPEKAFKFVASDPVPETGGAIEIWPLYGVGEVSRWLGIG